MRYRLSLKSTTDSKSSRGPAPPPTWQYRRLEGDRERRRRSRRARQPVRDMGGGEFGGGEMKPDAMLGLGDRGAQVVAHHAGLGVQERRRQKQLQREAEARAAAPQRCERALQRGEEIAVAVEERRGRAVRLIAEQAQKGSFFEPQLAQLREGGAELKGERQGGAVHAARARAADHVHARRAPRQLQEMAIHRVRLGDDACDLVGDAAHPHREADAAVHDEREPHLLAPGGAAHRRISDL